MNNRLHKKMRLGDLLVENKLITKEQLREALDYQKDQGGKLGQVLISLGYISQKSINEVLEYQLGIPYIDLDEYQIDAEIAQLVSEILVKRHTLIPVSKINNELVVAMEDPLNIYAIDDIKIYTGLEVAPALAAPEKIRRAIDIYFGKQEAMKAAEEYRQEQGIQIDQDQLEGNKSENEMAKSAPMVKLVNSIFEQAVHTRVSDIHIEPFDKNIRIRYRIDGKLNQVMEYEIALLPAIVARIKVLAGLDIAEKRKPQDGRIAIKVDHMEYDLRVSTLPTVHGEKIVIRITDKAGLNKRKEELGLREGDLQRFDNILKNPYGMILVTGPTGSGKSTTLYTLLNELNQEDINIITVEDPVEANVEGINQVQTNPKIGLDFATVLRSILRQDPDIIMIGEIRDSETAEIAIKASVTGHLVVSTLHTNDAPSTITRLLDMDIEPYLIGVSVVGVISQRLIRKLCPRCKQPYHPTEADLKILHTTNPDVELFRPVGCHACNQTGYNGRMGVFEIMPISSKLRELIHHQANADEIRKEAGEEGMKSLRDNASKLVLQGITSIEELLNIAYSIE